MTRNLGLNNNLAKNKNLVLVFSSFLHHKNVYLKSKKRRRYIKNCFKEIEDGVKSKHKTLVRLRLFE